MAGPGLIWVMGSDCTARPLDGARVALVPDWLDVRLPDPGAPRVRVQLDQASDRAAWAGLVTEETPDE